MNINLGQLVADIEASRHIVQDGMKIPLDPNSAILVQDAEYITAFQVWFTRADKRGYLYVTSDGLVVETPYFAPNGDLADSEIITPESACEPRTPAPAPIATDTDEHLPLIWPIIGRGLLLVGRDLRDLFIGRRK